MKMLILARHGAAQLSNQASIDFERKLTEQGKKDVLKVAQELAAIITPQLIISSTAQRAFQTAIIYADVFSIDHQKIIGKEKIYAAGITSLLKIINNINGKYDTVLLVGHNPTFELAIEYLSDVSIGNFPTSGIAIIEFEVDEWKLVSGGLGTLRKIVTP